MSYPAIPPTGGTQHTSRHPGLGASLARRYAEAEIPDDVVILGKRLCTYSSGMRCSCTGSAAHLQARSKTPTALWPSLGTATCFGPSGSAPGPGRKPRAASAADGSFAFCDSGPGSCASAARPPLWPRRISSSSNTSRRHGIRLSSGKANNRAGTSQRRRPWPCSRSS